VNKGVLLTLGLYVNANNSYFQNRSELLAAYHFDKPWGTMWLGPGNITSVEVRRFFYTNDTATGGGNSGAPVYSWHTETSNWQADAIHTYEYDPPTNNSGSRITQEVFNTLMNW
jgi:glutamyl endopeptidase